MRLLKRSPVSFPCNASQIPNRYSILNIVWIVKAEQQPVHFSPSSVWQILAHDAIKQIENYFSILQRKVLATNDVKDIKELKHRILTVQNYYMKYAKRFNWKYICYDLKRQFER